MGEETERFVICEGSGCPAHYAGTLMIGWGICSMCGSTVNTNGPGNIAILHKRLDILANPGGA